MRLIDYDALEEYAIEYQERHTSSKLTIGEFMLIANFMFECPKTDAIQVAWLEDKLNATAVTNPDLNNAIFYVLVAWEQEKQNREQEAR